MPASIVQRAFLEEGVKVYIVNHGVDVGTDVTAGRRRATKKLKEREQTGNSKAKRVSVLSRIDARCKTMGKTGVMPTSTYGSSAVGADEGNIKRQKRNLAIASRKRTQCRNVEHTRHRNDIRERRTAGHKSTHEPHRSVAKVFRQIQG